MLQIVLLGILAALVIFVARQIRLLARSGVDVHPRRTGRLLGALLLGVALSLGMHADYASKRAEGRKAFLESQTHRFDTYISQPHSVVADLILGILFAGSAIAAYELIAWGFYLAIKTAKKDGAA